jgi:oligopeptide transport system substrate-binding protein
MAELLPRRRGLMPCAVAGLTVLMLGACGDAVPTHTVAPGRAGGPVGGASGVELAAEQVLRKGNGAEPESLDPHHAESVTASNVLRDLYEGLVAEAADGTLIPGAAESWKLSADGLVYTFRMRPGARWSNGDPVTAADFEYGLKRSADPATLNEYAAILTPIENADAVVAGELPPERLGVKATDELTLEIRVHTPTPYLLGLLTHASTYAVHRPSIAAHGQNFARPGTLVGNGAYRLAEWSMQSHIRLVRNPYYWDDANTTLDEVWCYSIENADAELNRYRAGELDLTDTVPARQLRWLKANLADELRIAPYLGSYVFGFNMTRPPFGANPALRKALALAVDREILTSRISGAGEMPAYSWVPPVTGYHPRQPEWGGWTQVQRDEEARRLYAQAGYTRDKPLRVQLLYNTDNNHRRLTAALAAMWRETLGVQTELLNQEWQVFLQTRREKLETEVFRYAWIGDYDDPFTFLEILQSTHGINDMGYSSPQYDALLSRASREANPARRMRLLADAEQLMLADLPMIPVYFYVSKKLVKPWVAGFHGNIRDHHPSRFIRILEH